jgi:hypothetical protein
MVKHCESEECGKAFIAARRDMRFCGASCRARAHTLKARRAKGLLGAAVTKSPVVTTATTATMATAATTAASATTTAGAQRGSAAARLDRLERQVFELAQALELGRTDAVRGLAEVSAELRVGRQRGEEAVTALRTRLDADVAAEVKKARSAAKVAQRLEDRLTQIEARQERALSLLTGQGQRLVAVEQTLAVILARLGMAKR